MEMQQMPTRPTYSLPADPDNALERSHVLQRNPPLPPAGRRLQATLSVLVNNTPCDSIYISEAAVALHHLHVPSGWYVEVPDDTEEDQPLSVRLSVEPPSPRNFPLCCVVFVDGHLSSRKPVEVKGCVTLQEGGSGIVRPFLLRRMEAPRGGGEESASEGEVVDDPRLRSSARDIMGPVGSIHFYVLPAVIDHRTRPPAAVAPAEAPTIPGASDKKEAMGAADLEVALGSAVGDNGWGPTPYRPAGSILAQVRLRYRKRKFFANLQSLIDATSSATECQEDNKQAIKPEREPQPALDSHSSVKAFVGRLARKENVEPGSLGRLLAELRRHGMAKVAHLRRLTRPQWCEVVRSAGLPASLAKSAMKLANRSLPPPRHPAACIAIE